MIMPAINWDTICAFLDGQLAEASPFVKQASTGFIVEMAEHGVTVHPDSYAVAINHANKVRLRPVSYVCMKAHQYRREEQSLLGENVTSHTNILKLGPILGPTVFCRNSLNIDWSTCVWSRNMEGIRTFHPPDISEYLVYLFTSQLVCILCAPDHLRLLRILVNRIDRGRYFIPCVRSF